MKVTHIFMTTIVALSFATGVYAQEALKGEIATVDEATGKVGIKMSGTTGSSDTTAPTQYKVEDGLLFNSIKPGDKVSFSAENVNGVMTIKKLTKE